MRKLFYFVSITICLVSCEKDKQVQEGKTIIIQPGPQDGNDVTATFHDGNPASADGNGNSLNELAIFAWTNTGAYVEGKAYISFDLSSIPKNAIVTSARLNLFGVATSDWCPQGNWGENVFLVQRVLSAWDQQTLSWNNAPLVSQTNQTLSTASTTPWYNPMSVSVTGIVQDMLAENKPYGFCLSVSQHSPYRSFIFGSSEVTERSNRPSLEISYTF
jgi:hypothetical protein